MSSLIRFHYDPLSEFERLFDEASNFRTRIRPFFIEAGSSGSNAADSFRPRIDLKESKDSNTVSATFELPGLKREDISIDLQQNRLTVSGESAAEKDSYAVRERRFGKFSRTLQLPFGTKPEDVKARLENGLLTVTFPKATPEQQSQRISIQ